MSDKKLPGRVFNFINKTPKYFLAKFSYKDPISSEQILKQDKEFWLKVGEDTLMKNIQDEENARKIKQAKNIIILIGDGMGISTITSARIYKGQQEFGTSGEEHELVFDKFPNSALVKTYNVDMQVPDSAGTATALFSGVKTRYRAIGVDVNCNSSTFNKEVYEAAKIESIMTWAQEANKDTGIVTTTRITHATPAATYAHANYRYWECDSELPPDVKSNVKDIARQLIEDAPGRNFKVILGGGQQHLGHTLEYTDVCTRNDGLNLTNTWIEDHSNSSYVFATNNGELNTVTDDTEYLLGIFSPDHMPYELVRNKGPTGAPSLTEMTRKALQILKKGQNGFVLMVEGGLIDQAHHKNYARLAMAEAAEFDKAVELAVNETGPETLIIVTADHSHSFTMEGYSKRGNDILGFTEEAGEANRPFLTLAYANGPGFDYHYGINTSNNTFPWRDVRDDENRLNDTHYQHIGAFKSRDGTHGGEDVAVFAKGPHANLIRGVVEQNYIAHLISYSGCFGPHAHLNENCSKQNTNAASVLRIYFVHTAFIYTLLLAII
ncbi:hypothetical protein NQ315_013278 [Exocentrus adspersus]|uniref:Alkaline phosphatase n=1 Tax=Exocentrus adspersus TaxID=1586481 RepID=A0AAV8VKT6_9CUCU|nr:hypothetical protein NQ315_013278 [Exocentrus adspersus]